MSKDTFIGTCQFCGSQVIPDHALEDQEQANSYAVEQCDCQGALRSKAIAKANITISDICAEQGEFEKLDPDIERELKSLAVFVIDFLIGAVSIATRGEKIKLTIKKAKSSARASVNSK